MPRIEITQRGSFDHTERYLQKLTKGQAFNVLSKYGQMGVDALASATPSDSGETAISWYYEIVQRKGYYSIRWFNRHVVEGRPIAILIQYGHATGTGGYVQGRDYIMPAIRSIFDQMASDAWKEVTSSG